MGAAAVATERPPASTLWGAMLAFLGPWDFVIIVAVVAFLFGMRPFARALRSLKSGGRELKRGIRGDDELPPSES
jgi:Sec-independent protein translocase protein TatA